MQFHARALIDMNGASNLASGIGQMIGCLLPDVELPEMIKQAVEIRQPQNQYYDDHAIQDRFDLPLHWDEPVDKPQQKPHCDDCDDDGGKGHIVLQSLFRIRTTFRAWSCSCERSR